MNKPDIAISPGLVQRQLTPLTQRSLWLMWVLLFFGMTYFETQNVGGVKYAVIWRALVLGPALFIILSRPLPIGTRELAPLFWAWVAFACAPLWSVGLGISDISYSIELSMNRFFVPIILMALLGLRRYDAADLCVRAFPLFLCLVSIPLLAGWLPPVGLQWSLAAVSGLDLTAYNSVFQNQHSASLAHAIAGIAAFTLAARFPGRPAIFYLVLGLGCFGLTVLTTARSGLLGLILGLIVVASFKKKLHLLAAPALLIVAALAISASVKPEIIDMVHNRMTGQTLYTKGPSADTLTSGRLTLQTSALKGWSQSEPLHLIFGVSRAGTRANIERLTGNHLIAHSAFVDELSAYGIVGFISLMAMLCMAYRLAWRNARHGFPAGLGMLVALCAYGMLQSIDYSFQNLIIGMVLILETRARLMLSTLYMNE
ncbi:MAG: O-antigen ligase family protein [Lautropia sp.]|nr:O-antigen ligase family protein [Lautropia sp.]